VAEVFWAIIFCTPVAQLAEATDSKPVQCEPNSHLGLFYSFISYIVYPTKCRIFALICAANTRLLKTLSFSYGF